MITRDNYEEFFLLYIDNELSIAEKQDVDQFVADNPDLREEWDTLLQCRIIPDHHLGYPNHDLLLRHDTQPGADITSEQPDFLSYIDGEMDQKDRMAVEEFIRLHPQSRLELEKWRQTVSYPDTSIVFPDKESLYKTARDKRIFLSPWFRIGAAAAIAGIAALIVLLPHAHTNETIAAGKAPDVKPAFAPIPASKAPSLAAGDAKPGAMEKKIRPAVTPATIAALYPLAGKEKQREVNADPDRQENEPKAAAVTTALPDQTHDALALVQTTDPIEGHPPVAKVGVPEHVDAKVDNDDKENPGISREQSSFATQALQNETNDPENNIFIDDNQAAPAKGKLRGIFRKVTRAFGQTADRDKDGQRQVLVGAFQFALK